MFPRQVTSPGDAVRKQNKTPMLEITESSDRRLGWVGRDLKNHLVPPPCHGQGHLPPARAAFAHDKQRSYDASSKSRCLKWLMRMLPSCAQPGCAHASTRTCTKTHTCRGVLRLHKTHRVPGREISVLCLVVTARRFTPCFLLCLSLERGMKQNGFLLVNS